jgi:hypothetical protein
MTACLSWADYFVLVGMCAIWGAVAYVWGFHNGQRAL